MTRRALLLGGSRFLGIDLSYRLLAAGYEVWHLNRGQSPDPFGDLIRRIRQDRRQPEFGEALRGYHFDATIDLCAYSATDVAAAVAALRGRTGHYFLISTGQVYLVREGYRPGMRESEYDGALMARPEYADDLAQWEYGVGKRHAESVLLANADFPSTRLRLPMVHGARDYFRRLESYVRRLLDGGPILLPPGHERIARHVFSPAVARAVVLAIQNPASIGKAFNLSIQESPSVADLVRHLGELLGARPELREVAAETLVDAGLVPKEVSPLSSRWMSCLDPMLAEREIGFVHEPLRESLSGALQGLLASPPREPLPGYDRRSIELRLAEAAPTIELSK